ncbi:MAG: YggS family pyridoxal phosphate-dependent enzyme [candidate division Zixibacteria bacterium]|nr:YggS family pyridoxal phosphate-dependent enzyme [candidate division Zixibacteria bacterium]
MKDDISKNLMELHGRIAEACEEADHDLHDITIVAVTKTLPASTIQTAVAAGLTNIGESRIQEAESKIRDLGHIARFHLIGHLQTNKVKKAVELFDVIQSVDSEHLADEINRRAAEINRTIECLVQVNTSGEESKYGIPPDQCRDLIAYVNGLPNIDLSGLMTIGPLTDDKDEVRAAFRACRELFRAGRGLVGDDFEHLSMGMSDDFSLAIAEGATMIRVGSAIFGPRED